MTMNSPVTVVAAGGGPLLDGARRRGTAMGLEGRLQLLGHRDDAVGSSIRARIHVQIFLSQQGEIPGVGRSSTLRADLRFAFILPKISRFCKLKCCAATKTPPARRGAGVKPASGLARRGGRYLQPSCPRSGPFRGTSPGSSPARSAPDGPRSWLARSRPRWDRLPRSNC